eukprot:CAMPEP_0185803626 /NCGR_PEP_ID=MMETSP1322-20130828/2762_1 /TAXON_ID=265543 /ORGANISM="Minutocellus polymorphus, Strain RCC2270" /LENGTH=193 /DNA_ID=CAMNT_0028499533 /DNA_START=57 /DNA_END=638 /DNA_ORIENTATION=-
MRFSTASFLLTTIASAALRPYSYLLVAAASVSSAVPDDAQASEYVTDDASFGHTHLRTDPSSGINHKAQPSGINRKASVEDSDPENIDLAVSDAENLADSATEKVGSGILAGGGAIKKNTLERNLGEDDGCDDDNDGPVYDDDDGKSPKSPKSPKSAKSAKSAKGGCSGGDDYTRGGDDDCIGDDQATDDESG